MNQKLVIFGNGELAEVAHFYFTHDSNYEVMAFTVDSEYVEEEYFNGLPVIPFQEVEQEFNPEHYHMHVSVGNSKRNSVREAKYHQAKQKGYDLASYISSKLHLWPNHIIGDNCLILEDNTIQPLTTIGNNVIMWSVNHLGHHSSIADHCFIASHVVISGGVSVGAHSFIGVNATIGDHITIAERSIIGAGALILEDTEVDGVYPAQTTSRSVR